MSADFLDSNVLLYLVSDELPKKQRAGELLANGGTVSVQVLDEFAAVATRKLSRSMDETRAKLSDIRQLCRVRVADLQTHERGLDIAERYRFSIYDSMLLASALEAGCRTFYSEDLH
ncbi:MAG: PIN domain-containing protein, partial [Rhizomicrobium sp.]